MINSFLQHQRKYLNMGPGKFHPSYFNNRLGYVVILFSHIFNLVPIYLAFKKSLPLWFCMVIILQTIFSFSYHFYFKNKTLRLFDWLAAIVLLWANLFIFLNIYSPYFIYKIIALTVLVIVALSIFMQTEKYPISHTIWHFMVSLMLCIVII